MVALLLTLANGTLMARGGLARYSGEKVAVSAPVRSDGLGLRNSRKSQTADRPEPRTSARSKPSDRKGDASGYGSGSPVSEDFGTWPPELLVRKPELCCHSVSIRSFAAVDPPDGMQRAHKMPARERAPLPDHPVCRRSY